MSWYSKEIHPRKFTHTKRQNELLSTIPDNAAIQIGDCSGNLLVAVGNPGRSWKIPAGEQPSQTH